MPRNSAIVSRTAVVRSSGRRSATAAIGFLQHARGDRVTLLVVAVEEALGRCPPDDLRESLRQEPLGGGPQDRSRGATRGAFIR